MKYNLLVFFLLLFQYEQNMFAAARPRAHSMSDLRVHNEAQIAQTARAAYATAAARVQATMPAAQPAGVEFQGQFPVNIDIPKFPNLKVDLPEKFPNVPVDVNIPRFPDLAVKIDDIKFSTSSMASGLGAVIIGFGMKLIADSFKVKEEGSPEERETQQKHKKSLIKGGAGLAVGGTVILLHQQIFALFIYILKYFHTKHR